ncbi:LamG-like jellyroll fold domain-containing protein [Marinimicrobium alkaliphilum]|uniref:LamG-like jellyroll fold domain-containing protein n=1 Tax=Marinimicrobium alkaliphilum TaxID=2202654 RepID=UPI000DBA7C99|nr:LamG-like jellyroll fold domain-containing protein [Marinimicrobium alkaliphilum]
MQRAALSFALLALLGLQGCGSSSGDRDTPDPQPPVDDTPPPTFPAPTLGVDVEWLQDAETGFNDLGVHDPSVEIGEDGAFYVVGSHLDTARSEDLIHWERVTLMTWDEYEVIAADGIDWSGGHVGSWASDFALLNDGNYYFYYNHCARPADGECLEPRSYLGVAKSESGILGPYQDLGLFLRSGHYADENVPEYSVIDEPYNGFTHPNVIDPHTFYDNDGKLWMVYGSYAGGIYILEMDETTGMANPGQGYGTHLTGGDFSAIEGTYMLYSPHTEYYYLFMSFGGYESQDGYNMRIARSRQPDGPFEDYSGQDIQPARGGWGAIEPYGVKIMGGFEFTSDPGDPYPSRGYLAPGHNSAYFDEETEQYYLITHTRFPNRGQAHSIRVHEMFVTEDGWLAASPHRYVPIEGDNIVDGEKLPGDYQLIGHDKDINREAKLAEYATLHADGSITGEREGSYSLEVDERNRVTLTLAGRTYEGVARWQWDNRLRELVPVVTAFGPDGDALWLSRLPDRSHADVVAAIEEGLELPDTFKGTALSLPTRGTRGAQVVWTSDNPSVINPDGSVTRPNVGQGDETVRLTATITLGDVELVRDFEVTVQARVPYNLTAHYTFDGDLADVLTQWPDAQTTGDRIFNSGQGSASFTDGEQGEALVFDGSEGVRLPDGLIDSYEYTVSLWVRPTAITPFTALFFGTVDEQNETGTPVSERWVSLLPRSWDDNTMVWSNNSGAWFDGSAEEQIPVDTWTHLAFAVERGRVTLYIDGESAFEGAGVADFFTESVGQFALGVNYWDTPFEGVVDELKVYEAALTGGEIVALDVERWPEEALLDSAHELLTLSGLAAVQEDFHLPVTGPYASAISWVSSDPTVIAVEGDRAQVTRPGATAADADVTLTATITLGGEQRSKTFEARVLSLAPPEPVASFRFDGNLDDSTGNFNAGQVTGNRIDNSGGTLGFAEGRSGQALQLDGSSGVRLPDGLIEGDLYAVSFWLRPEAISQFTTAFFGAVAQNSWISLVPQGPGAGNTMLWSGEAWYDAAADRRIGVGEWTHVAFSYNGGGITLYLDGELAYAGDNFPNVFAGSGGYFALGVNHWDTPFQGLVDELLIFDQPLSGSDVEALASAP